MMVIDASAMVKWYLPEPGTEHIGAFIEEGILFSAPDLIRTEVTGAICRRVRAGEMETDTAARLCQLWLSAATLPLIQLVPTEEVLADAVRLSLALLHPLQDCLYLAVAERASAPLLTADQVFYRRAQPHYAGIRLLTEAVH